MMGIVVPGTCWDYKKYNKIISGIYLAFILQKRFLFICDDKLHRKQVTSIIYSIDI